MLKYSVVLGILTLFLMIPGIAITAVLTPCTVVAFANANTYIQGPGFSQTLNFEGDPPSVKLNGCPALKTATIIVANPPQNPPPTAPVYMSLAGATTTGLLLVQGTTVITTDDFPTWFLTTATYTGVTITCPSTPWVPSSITIIWQ
jgi:hypothetical protein